MPEPTRTFILDDLPTDTDALDFQPYVDTLVDIVQTGSTPLTVGVFGTWGSGKTSLMKMIKKSVEKDKNNLVVWFNAWKYDKEETLWRSFLLSIISELKKIAQENIQLLNENAKAKTKSAGEKAEEHPIKELEQLETTLYREVELEKIGGVTIDLAKLGPVLARNAVQIGLSFIPGGFALNTLIDALKSGKLSDAAIDAIHRERTKIHIEQMQFLEQFERNFKKLVSQYVIMHGGRVVVFVDDLDRCLPEKAIEVLESIKLFVDVPGCVFILGIDQDIIARSVEIRYKDFLAKDDPYQISGMHYLEKIIQLPFQIPPVEKNDMNKFVRDLTTNWPGEDKDGEEITNVFAIGLGDNPRQIKRTVNVFLMLWKLAEKRKEKLKGRIKPIRLAKVVVIQSIAPDFYKLLKDQSDLLGKVENYYRELDAAQKSESLADDKTPGQKRIASEEKARVALPPELLNLLERTQAVHRILTMHSLDLLDANFSGLQEEELRLYFTLTRRAEAPQVAPAEPARLVFEPQMVKIPAGKFKMGTTLEQAAKLKNEDSQLWEEWVQWEQPSHEVELPEYSIGKYPVTNREYQVFIKEAGHRPPHGWDNNQYPPEKGDHPVVNISWNDAQEYCGWLSRKTNKTYRLPTDAEWEKAARGDNDWRVYPWGDDFDPIKANTREAKIGDTTPVGQFSPQGDSPYGCADMAGNVLEWCADWFEEDEYKNRKGGVESPTGPKSGQDRVLHGGAWLGTAGGARCAYRGRCAPDDFGIEIGFRVCVSPILKSEL